MSYSYSADEVKSIGIFQIAERKETYHEDDLDVQVTAHAIQEGGGTLALFLSEDEASDFEEQGVSLAPGSQMDLAILKPRGA